MRATTSIRTGSIDDLDAVLSLFDQAVVWLVAKGREAQWGSEPWSTDSRKSEFVRTMLEGTDVLIVEDGAIVVGAAAFASEPMPYVPKIEEPEIYIHLLITSTTYRGAGIGHQLLGAIREESGRRGVDLLRVDCWAGGDRKLVERSGFTPTEEIAVRHTSVQVFEQRLIVPGSIP